MSSDRPRVPSRQNGLAAVCCRWTREGESEKMEAYVTDEIQRRAQQALDDSPVCDLRDVRVDRHDTGLTISGVVSSFYHKQLAQETIRVIAKEIEVVNSVQVR
jgi:hypothetical protein